MASKKKTEEKKVEEKKTNKLEEVISSMKSATDQLMPRIPSNLIIMEYGAYALGFNEAKAAFIQLCDDIIATEKDKGEQK